MVSKGKTKTKKTKHHSHNELHNHINIHIRDHDKKKKKRKSKKRIKKQPEGVDSHYPLIIPPQQQYYINNSRPFDYGNNNESMLKAYIDAKFKDHEPKSTSLTHEIPTKKQEEEPIFFTDENGNPIESEGSFFANVSVKRRNNKDHYTFSKAEPTLENQAKATGADEVIIPVSEKEEEKEKPVEIESDIFGDNNNVHENDEPFQDQEITNTGLKPEPEKTTPINQKRDAFLKQIEEEDKLRKEIKALADDYNELKNAFSSNPNGKITSEEWQKFKSLAKAINYDRKKLSNTKQKKALALQKLVELEPILEAEINRREQEIKNKKEDSKTRYPPENKGIFQTIQDYTAPVLGGVAGVSAIGQGIDYLYKLKKATDIPNSVINGVANVITNPSVQTAVSVGQEIGVIPKIKSPYPSADELGFRTPVKQDKKGGSYRVKKRSTQKNRTPSQIDL